MTLIILDIKGLILVYKISEFLKKIPKILCKNKKKNFHKTTNKTNITHNKFNIVKMIFQINKIGSRVKNPVFINNQRTILQSNKYQNKYYYNNLNYKAQLKNADIINLGIFIFPFFRFHLSNIVFQKKEPLKIIFKV